MRASAQRLISGRLTAPSRCKWALRLSLQSFSAHRKQSKLKNIAWTCFSSTWNQWAIILLWLCDVTDFRHVLLCCDLMLMSLLPSPVMCSTEGNWFLWHECFLSITQKGRRICVLLPRCCRYADCVVTYKVYKYSKIQEYTNVLYYRQTNEIQLSELVYH